MKLPLHGSNPKHLYQALDIRLPERFIDFSANINPQGPPKSIKVSWPGFYEKIGTYPDPYGLQLKEAIAEKEGIPIDSLLVGNGGAELITLVGRMLAGKKVLIVQPAFTEYEAACRANDCDISYYQLNGPEFEWNQAEFYAKTSGADALFLCNPNNPTGIQFSTSLVVSIIEKCEKQACTVILDEAFYDFLEDYESFISYINRFSNLIVIRSMTKMFAIPGIRLGYLAASPAVIAGLGRMQPHWSINSIALEAGVLCLNDEPFISRTKQLIGQERERLFEFFQSFGFQTSDSKVNFYLLRDSYFEDQLELFTFLLQKGIVPRHTYNFPGLEGRWLRFAIKGKEENTRLMEVLVEWRKSHPYSL
ncbi:threonine-phosphate decarboxylase CobD [Neobacillus sp. Marseille-QA0830]